MPPETVVTQSTTVVAERHSANDKPALVPLGFDAQWACSGRSSMQPDITAPADVRPLPASHYQPPKAKSPERTFSESVPFAMNSRGIGPATSTVGKEPAPQASGKPPMTTVNHKQPATAAPIKRDTSSQYDAIPQKQLNVDSASVNNNSRDYTVKPYSVSTAPHPPSPECLVSAHDVRGVVVQVHERSAIVDVEQDNW
ncbi:hypothetical protein MTO96_020018 [Rhipicephalus appendiculatus]